MVFSGIALARRAPQAEIVAQDWANVLKIAEAHAQASGVGDRYTLLPGDAFTVEFGKGYDVCSAKRICSITLTKVRITLMRRAMPKSRGQLLTLEFIPNEDRVTPPIPASFSLMMLGLTPVGDAYTMQQFESMLGQAGFTQNRLNQVPSVTAAASAKHEIARNSSLEDIAPMASSAIHFHRCTVNSWLVVLPVT